MDYYQANVRYAWNSYIILFLGLVIDIKSLSAVPIINFQHKISIQYTYIYLKYIAKQ